MKIRTRTDRIDISKFITDCLLILVVLMICAVYVSIGIEIWEKLSAAIS